MTWTVPPSLEWTELISKSLNEMKMEMRENWKWIGFISRIIYWKINKCDFKNQALGGSGSLVHGTVPVIIFTSEDGLRLWVLLTVSLWKKVRKFECWLVSRSSCERNHTEEVLVVWWEPGQPGGTNHHRGLSATITLIWEARDPASLSRPPQVTSSNSGGLRVKFGFGRLVIIAYFTGQVWTEAKEIRSNFTYNLSWYRAITVITNVSLNGERNVDNSKVSNNELVNCPDEIVLHLLLQMLLHVLFLWHWHLSLGFLKGFRWPCLTNWLCGSL